MNPFVVFGFPSFFSRFSFCDRFVKLRSSSHDMFLIKPLGWWRRPLSQGNTELLFFGAEMEALWKGVLSVFASKWRICPSLRANCSLEWIFFHCFKWDGTLPECVFLVLFLLNKRGKRDEMRIRREYLWWTVFWFFSKHRVASPGMKLSWWILQ